jgi:hypothetical protein
MRYLPLSPLLCLFIAIVIALHQFIYYGVWFEVADIHHETFMITFAFTGLTLYMLKRGHR